jgi:hypothetical protein
LAHFPGGGPPGHRTRRGPTGRVRTVSPPGQFRPVPPTATTGPDSARPGRFGSSPRCSPRKPHLGWIVDRAGRGAAPAGQRSFP